MTTETDMAQMPAWPSASTYNRSIRREVSLYVGGLVVVLMLVTGLIVTDKLVDTVTESAVDKILVQSRSYAGAAAKQIIGADGPDALTLTDICRRLKGDNRECGWVGIADNSGSFLAHTDLQQVIRGYKPLPAQSTEFDAYLRQGEVMHLTDDSIIVAVPITEQGVSLGTLTMGSSAEQIAFVRKAALTTMSLITLVMALVGVQLTAVILRRRLRPLALITESLRKVEIGNMAVAAEVKDHNEFGYLAETLRVMGARLEQAQRLAVESERMTRELEIAREIQANILPKSFPDGPGFQLSGIYKSARTVGGDYYDFIDLGSGKLGIVIADVSGKSLPGMLVMLLTRDLVIKHARRTSSPAQLLSAVNRELLPEIRKGTFVTMLYAILDTACGQISFASAGHNPLIHVNAAMGKPSLIKTKGYPLGMMSPTQFDLRIESASIDLGAGDLCVLYTDGINEAMNTERKEYGMDAFVSVVMGHATHSAAQLTQAIVSDVDRFVGNAMQADDITLLSLKWAGTNDSQRANSATESVYAASR